MTPRTPWFQRRFTFDLPVGVFPSVVERVRGTPARLAERLRGLPGAFLTRRDGDAWSIQENVGHLLDLEPLWLGRLEETLAGAPTLRAADLTNRTTVEANHNARPLGELVDEFRAARRRFVERLDGLTQVQVAMASRHPRLGVPMRVIDLAWFVAEHDDHHLARISELMG